MVHEFSDIPPSSRWSVVPLSWSLERGLHLVTLMNSVGEAMCAIPDRDIKGTVTSS